MDTNKSDSLEDHFELPSFGLKIYNMNTGNQTVTVVTLPRRWHPAIDRRLLWDL